MRSPSSCLSKAARAAVGSAERPVAFVTGASQGIGAATAVKFAAAGYDLALLAPDDEALAQVASHVRELGASAAAYTVDLVNLELARDAIRACVVDLGRLDVLVNNAAWRTLQTMRAIDLETWDRTVRICLTAPAFLARWAAGEMEARRTQGAILNVSSMMSTRASGVSPAYVACKGGLDALTFELAALYGPSGIRVVSVCPGWVETGMSGDYKSASGDSLNDQIRAAAADEVPLRRPASPEEIAAAIVWLAGPEASYVTGTRFLIDGGWSHHHLRYSLHRMQFPEEFR